MSPACVGLSSRCRIWLKNPQTRKKSRRRSGGARFQRSPNTTASAASASTSTRTESPTSLSAMWPGLSEGHHFGFCAPCKWWRVFRTRSAARGSDSTDRTLARGRHRGGHRRLLRAANDDIHDGAVRVFSARRQVFPAGGGRHARSRKVRACLEAAITRRREAATP